MVRLKVVAALVALFPGCAAATTPVIFPPGEQLAKSSVVVIAVPRTISCRVTSTSTSGLVMANAKVTWQVLVRWKGPLRIGETFTSNESIASGDKQPCFYSCSRPLLLYLNGKQPFGEVWWYDLGDSVDRLQELDVYRSRHGT
jgi:hypothetical protein